MLELKRYIKLQKRCIVSIYGMAIAPNTDRK